MAEVETVRRVIGTESCDMLGHMNVSAYFGLASDGGFARIARFGLGPDQLTAGRQQSFAVVHSDAVFKAEVRPGQEIVVRSGLLEIGGASAKFRHRIFLGEKMAFQTVFTCALFDLKARKAALIDDALRREMETYLIDET